MKKAFAWILLFSISLILCACELQPVAGAENSNAELAEEKSTATAKVTEDITEATAATMVTQTTEDGTEPQITVADTTAEPQPQDWRAAYVDFLEGAKDYHVAFALVYIDGDDIPELYLNGDCEATGDAICTYKNGRVIELRLRRTWGGSYIPGAGLIKNTNGNMGYYTTDIYRLTDSGFASIWCGLEVQEMVPPANENEEPTLDISFSIGDKTVSEEEYYAAIEEVFNTSQAIRLHENTVSFDEIRQLIMGN